MSLTTLVWLFLIGVSAVGAFVNPIFGLFGYLVEYFQRPALYWWGREVPDLRWNFTMATIAVAAYALRRTSLEPVRRDTMVPLALMLLLSANSSLVTLWAIDPDLSWRWSTAIWKLTITFALFSWVVRNPRGLDLVILFQIVGAAYWGWDALDSRRIGSRLEGVGSGDTQNSNLLAAHVLTIIPLTVMFVLSKSQLWMRGIALLSLPFIINLLILCNSRGATLGLGAAGVAAFVLVRKGLRLRVALGGLAAGVMVLLLADPEFLERQRTITDPTDNSAQSRTAIWSGGLEMIKDYPFGTGGRGFHVLSPRYIAEIRESGSEGRSAHNMYLQLAADWGIQWFVLFVALMGYVFTLLHRVRRERPTADRIYLISLGIQLGLIGTLGAAFFSSRLYGESIYWLCGLATALYCMTEPVVTVPQAARADADTLAA